jgi:hypothetical protein
VVADTAAAWLSDAARGDALLNSWQGAAKRPLAAYETGALAAAARAAKTRTPINIAIPGGRSRLPLLAAVHAAALQLPGFPSPFSDGGSGLVALVTTQVVRRAELADLDAAGVPVSPALHPARLRSDGLLAPLPGGKAVVQESRHRLLLVTPSASWVVPQIPPTVAVIDASTESRQFATEAAAWATACGATPIAFTDIADIIPVDESVTYPCGWSQILAAATSPDDVGIADLASVRGHAAVLGAGPMPGLSSAASLLTAARRAGQIPAVLVEASVLWRRLDELVVPIARYDAACPRWHTPTLSERLEDLLEVRSRDFPREWLTWAETNWAGIKEGLVATRDALRDRNSKSALLTQIVDADLRAGLAVDIALPSRTARDALTWHLTEAGVPIPSDGLLTVRSLADAGAWEPPRATLLAAPPARLQRRRVTAADIGPLNVLCYDHEIKLLRSTLCDALDEPENFIGPFHQMLPPALDLVPSVLTKRPTVVLTMPPSAEGARQPDGGRLAYLADISEIIALETLRESPQELDGDLPDEEDQAQAALSARSRCSSGGYTLSVPLSVISSSGRQAFLVHVPADGKAVRILDGTVCQIPVREVLPGMFLVGLDGLTP